MKYIRTKDELGILVENDKDIKDKYGDYLKKGCYFKTWFSPNTNRDDIINQADTIEELCDEFVDTSELRGTNTGGWLYDEFDSKNKCLVYYAEDERRTIPLNEFEDLSKIYGAIWTDKGLIYVAKMNEKGELELL